MTSQDDRIGLVLDDRYRIISHIATGAMGEIYRAERLRLGRPVAIKILQAPLANEKTFVQRFELEARALSRLSHPNCVSIIDFGVAKTPYLVMDYVHGHSLREVLRKGPMVAPRAIHIFRQVLAALAHAHGNGIIHRDVKPGNIMLTEATGTGDHIRILDFGLAKLRSVAMDSSVTGSAKVIGTPAYMSPEQAEGKTVDVRSDVYAAGIVLFEMLTGKKPFDSDKMMDVLEMHLRREPPALSQASSTTSFSPELETVISKALAKARKRRYQTALEFAEAVDATPEASMPLLRFYGRSKQEPRRTAVTQHTKETVIPRRSLARTLAIPVLAGLVFAGILAWFSWEQGIGQWQNQAPAKPLRQPGRMADPRTGNAGKPQVDAKPQEMGIGSAETAVPDGDGDQAAVTASDSAVEQAVEVVLDGAEQQAEEVVLESPEEQAAQPAPDNVKASVKEKWQAEVTRLMKLTQKNTRSAYYPYKLGQLYFQRQWWGAGIKAYSMAIQRNPKYRKRRALIQDVITALGGRKTMSRAWQMIERQIGRPALRYLKRAARKHRYGVVRKKSAQLVERLQQKRR